jgi:hypothetical protein
MGLFQTQEDIEQSPIQDNNGNASLQLGDVEIRGPEWGQYY